MTDPARPPSLPALVAQLVEQWREEADREEATAAAEGSRLDQIAAEDISNTLHGCADQLAQALAEAPRQETAPDKGQVSAGIAVEAYATLCGGVHDDDCPADDTCTCSGKWINDGITAAVKYLRGATVPRPQEEERK
jgi:hypothetical protein